MAALAAACTSPPEQTEPTPGPTAGGPAALRVGIGTVAGLDPAELSSPDSILVASQIFDGLIRYDASTGGVLPAVAERWDILDGGRRFIFHLGESRFHDGSVVTSEHFVFAWNRLVDPATPRPFAFLLEAVQGFRQFRETLGARPFSGLDAPDPNTLEVRLRYPWHDFVAILGHPALSPVPAAAGERGFASRPIGNGPYRLAGELGLESPIVLEAFEGYTGVAPGVRNVELRPVEDPASGWPDFLAEELDVAPIPAALVRQASVEFGSEGVQPNGRVLYCGFNLSLKRLRDPRLRRAVSLAADRGELVEAVFGQLAIPADRIVPPSIPGSRPENCGDNCQHAPERAADIVAALPRESRTFSLDFARSATGELVAETLAGQLREVGLRVTPRGHDQDEYARLLSRQEQAFFCLTAVPDYPRQPALLEPLLHSDAQENHTGFSDRGLDRLLEEARAEPDPVEREELYVDVEQRALELMPVVPLAWFRAHYAAQSYVRGLNLDPLGSFDVAALSIAG